MPYQFVRFIPESLIQQSKSNRLSKNVINQLIIVVKKRKLIKKTDELF